MSNMRIIWLAITKLAFALSASAAKDISPHIGNVNTMMIWLKTLEVSRVLNCFVSFVLSP